LHQALSIAKQVSDHEARDDMLVRLGDKYGMAEAYDHALECAELIEDDFNQITLYKYLARKYIDIQNYAQANLIIEKAERSRLNDWFLEDLVKSYLVHQDFTRAIDAIERMTEEKAKVTALSNIAYKYWRIGYESAATKSLDQAKEIADQIPDSYTQSWCLHKISKVAKQISTTQKADSLLATSVNEAQQINDQFSQGFAFNNLAFQLASAGKYDEAIEMIETSNPFIPKFQKVRLLIAIANQCQKLNQAKVAEEMIDRAMRTVEEIDGSDLPIPKADARFFAPKDIDNYALQQQQYDLAFMILQKIEPSYGKLHLLVAISNTYIENGEQQKAGETLQKAVEQIKESKNLYLSEEIALMYAQIKDYYSAIKTVKLLLSDLGQSTTLVKIALKYAEFPQPIQPATLEMIETWG
jgi:tetratricopeptide (TPR) repeat protein